MLDEPTPTVEMSPSDEPKSEEPKAVSKVRRISNKPARKNAKPSIEKTEIVEPASVPVEEFDSASSEKEGPTEGGEDSSSDPKRKNRRRRGKCKSSNNDVDGQEKGSETEEPNGSHEVNQDESGGRQDRPQGRQNQQHQRPQKQRQKLDSQKVANKAWKIYLAEVSEEGVALIGDNDARELSRRCFRLAELFLEEQERRS